MRTKKLKNNLYVFQNVKRPKELRFHQQCVCVCVFVGLFICFLYMNINGLLKSRGNPLISIFSPPQQRVKSS